MKNFCKLFGFVFLVALTVFIFAGCDVGQSPQASETLGRLTINGLDEYEGMNIWGLGYDFTKPNSDYSFEAAGEMLDEWNSVQGQISDGAVTLKVWSLDPDTWEHSYFAGNNKNIMFELEILNSGHKYEEGYVLVDFVNGVANATFSLEPPELDFVHTEGKLTIKGLDAYNGMYVWGMGENPANPDLEKIFMAAAGFLDYEGRPGFVYKGAVTLKVWIWNSMNGDVKNYTGDNKNIVFKLFFQDKGTELDHEIADAGFIDGTVEANFTKGVATGTFIPGEPETNIVPTAGRLTITGLEAYEGKYIWGQGKDPSTGGSVYDFIAAGILPKKVDGRPERITNGTVTLNVWDWNTAGSDIFNYTGNDTGIKFDLNVVASKLSIWSASVIDNGYVVVNFVNGVASGTFISASSGSYQVDTTNGRLTITGLGDYNGKYVWGSGANRDGLELFAGGNFSTIDENGKQAVLISGGIVTLNVWNMISDTYYANYKGNNVVIMNLNIMNSSSVSAGGTPIKKGYMILDFSNGVATGKFMPFGEGAFYAEETTGRLTVTGLNAYNGNYICGSSYSGNFNFFAAGGNIVSANEYKAALISGGTTVLKIWNMITETHYANYDRNDKNIGFVLLIYADEDITAQKIPDALIMVTAGFEDGIGIASGG